MAPYIGGEKGQMHGGGFSKGVNFAVAGATALDFEFYEKLGFHNPDNKCFSGNSVGLVQKFLRHSSW